MRETSIALSLSFFAFVMTVIWGNPFIRLLHFFKVGKIIREEGPDKHQEKLGTPTMGGLMIIAPVLLITILLNAATMLGFDILGQSMLLPLLVLITFGITKVEASRVGLILLLQPTLAYLWDILFFAKPIIPLEITGAILALIAIYLGTVGRRG